MLQIKSGDIRNILRQDHALRGKIRPGHSYHVSIYPAGADDMDADIFFVKLCCQCFGKTDQRMFGCSVSTLLHITFVSGDRSNIQDGGTV